MIFYAGPLGQATLPSGYETSSEVSEQHLKGEINLIVGPMFAGKTSELLRRVEDHEVCPCFTLSLGACFRFKACACHVLMGVWAQISCENEI